MSRTSSRTARTRPARSLRKVPKSARGRKTSPAPRTLLVIGDSARTSRVERVLDDLEVTIRRAVWDPKLPESIGEETLGIVLVAVLPEVKMPLACKVLGEGPRLRRVPIFVLLEDGADDAEVRKVYRSGATAVFHWPREALILARLLAELLGIDRVRGRARQADTALARRVRAQLRLMPAIGQGIRIRCRNGAVYVSGETRSYREKLELEETVSHVPGVKLVSTREVRANPARVPDREISRTVDTLLERASDIDARTLSVEVHNGCVVLAGLVADRAELERVMELIAHVQGVRDVENVTTVSQAAKSRDGSTARRLRRLLLYRFPNEDVDIDVFGGVAVLRGRVSRLGTRREVERFVVRQEAVGKLLNKIEVI